MTNPNLTEIVYILDASGSMHSLSNDVIGSFNKTIKDQKEVPGEARVTVVTFNSSPHYVMSGAPITQAPELSHANYQTGGNTALLDAIGDTINLVGSRLAAEAEDNRPGKVIVIIHTDGEENASTRFSFEQIRSMITHQRDTYKWEFVYMGANVDAFDEAKRLGISPRNSLQYRADAVGIKMSGRVMRSVLDQYRATGQTYSDDQDSIADHEEDQDAD